MVDQYEYYYVTVRVSKYTEDVSGLSVHSTYIRPLMVWTQFRNYLLLGRSLCHNENRILKESISVKSPKVDPGKGSIIGSELSSPLVTPL